MDTDNLASIVAPRVGAWIETLATCCASKAKVSHPVWVRGLKLLMLFHTTLINNVAPRVGAWIETLNSLQYITRLPSHPVWVRGLKRRFPSYFSHGQIVAPRVGAWIETLTVKLKALIRKVAPRVGAWIETIDALSHHADKQVAPRVGAWIETEFAPQEVNTCKSHPVWVRGLKLKLRPTKKPLRCRTPCGCVD